MYASDCVCVLATQCRNYDQYAYAYTGSCEDIRVNESGNFDTTQKENGIYDCGEKYLDIT